MIQNLNLELSSKARFDSIDGASLMEKDLPRKKFIINSLLTSGLSIIAGSPKVGKSWLVLDWCVRIAKGEDVWSLHTDSGTTLYLSLEDDESRLQDRLTAIMTASSSMRTSWTHGDSTGSRQSSLKRSTSTCLLPRSFSMPCTLTCYASHRPITSLMRLKESTSRKACRHRRSSPTSRLTLYASTDATCRHVDCFTSSSRLHRKCVTTLSSWRCMKTTTSCTRT